MAQVEIDLLIEFKENLNNFGTKSFIEHDKMKQIICKLNEWIYPDIIEMLLANMNITYKPKEKEYLLLLIKILIEESDIIIKYNLINLIPAVIDLLCDVKEYVRSTAKEILIKLMYSCENEDLTSFLPIIIKSIENIDFIPEAIDRLLTCVFIQNVECDALSILEPIIIRGLKHKINEVQKKTYIIIDNIYKSIKHPKEINSKIKPLIINCSLNNSNPEIRSIANKTLITLSEIFGENEIIIKESEDIFKLLKEEFSDESFELEYLSKLLKNMCNYHYFEYDIWLSLFNNYLEYNIDIISDVCNNIIKKYEN